ncbi:Na(+)/H(+) exchange regulatory cofactor NHE-RF1-like isoform X2 [Dreissena polymorpha]|uniref:Na(+)/H(+) exchange regulatory cofactor NHE-RF1-like isoform X2 n=1 Tax=Dreissena polymorpha TaxID=45954 RepID=UPI0022645927|nr:Na(+)/H(+) exchange regulatory cofactor NHE-RF1-like isoform X2 [Dreissena polymorpha]
MGDENLFPRLCTIRKWPDFAGFGFNLHAERGRAGQYIGKVDDNSPAQAAGMKEGDRIVEVNGTNIGNENHSQVVNRIKASGDEVTMLLVDAETDKHFKDLKMVVSSDMDEVVRLVTPPRSGDDVEDGEKSADEDDKSDDRPPSEEPPHYSDVQHDQEEVPSSPEPEPEQVVTKAPVKHDFHPRLCHIRKWPDFQGYGFNLHAEKDKKGQYIGLVDANSPAEDAGLKKGDRIIEVNGDNIEDVSHQQVIQKIKAGGEETIMLVVDPDADDFYKNNGITITVNLPEVIKGETKPRTASASASKFQPRLCHIIKWPDFNGYGFNLHAEKEQGGQYIGKIDANSPAEEAGLKENDRIVEVNNVNIESESHGQVISRIKAGGDETKLLVVDREADNYYKSKGIPVSSSLPEVKRMSTTRRSPKPGSAVTNGSHSTKVSQNVSQPARTEPAKVAPAQANGGDLLSMNLSAKEMRERISKKNKHDAKTAGDFKSKYEIFQKM